MTKDKLKISNKSLVHYKYGSKNVDDGNDFKEKKVNFYDILKNGGQSHRKMLSESKHNLILRQTECHQNENDKYVFICQDFHKNLNDYLTYQDCCQRKMGVISQNNIDPNQKDKDLSEMAEKDIFSPGNHQVYVTEDDVIPKPRRMSLVPGKRISIEVTKGEENRTSMLSKKTVDGKRYIKPSPSFQGIDLNIDVSNKNLRNNLLSNIDLKIEKDIQNTYQERLKRKKAEKSGVNAKLSNKEIHDNEPKNYANKMAISRQMYNSNYTSHKQTDSVKPKSSNNNNVNSDNRNNKYKGDSCKNKFFYKLKHRMNTVGCKFEFTYAVPSIGFFRIKQPCDKKKNKTCAKCKDKNGNKESENKKNSMRDNKSIMRDNKSIDSDESSGQDVESWNLNYVKCFYENNNKKCNGNKNIDNNLKYKADINAKYNNLLKFKTGNNFYKPNLNFYSKDNLNENTSFHEFKGNSLCRHKNNFDILYHNLNYQLIDKKIFKTEHNLTSKKSILGLPTYSTETKLSEALRYDNKHCFSFSLPNEFGLDYTNCTDASEKLQPCSYKDNEIISRMLGQSKMDKIMDTVVANALTLESDTINNHSEVIQTVNPECLPSSPCNIVNSHFNNVSVLVNDVNGRISHLKDQLKTVLVKHDIECNGNKIDDSIRPTFVEIDDMTKQNYGTTGKRTMPDCQVALRGDGNNDLSDNKYSLSRSISNSLCIKPPQIKKYKSCNCCVEDENNCCSVRIRLDEQKCKNVRQCVDLSDKSNKRNNKNNNDGILTKFTNYFTGDFSCLDDSDSFDCGCCPQ